VAFTKKFDTSQKSILHKIKADKKRMDLSALCFIFLLI